MLLVNTWLQQAHEAELMHLTSLKQAQRCNTSVFRAHCVCIY